MIASVACPGPSLLRTFQPADLTIAVNRAGLLVPCDWLAALDHPLIQEHLMSLRGKCRLLTNAESRRHVEWDGMIAEQLFDYCPHPINWCTYTKTAAIVLAAHLGATTIRVYGDDQTAAPDADGVQLPSNRRDPSRWEAERAIGRTLAAWLRERGVRVERVLDYEP